MELTDVIKKELDDLFEKVETPEEINNLRFRIDDYSDNGYNVKDYIHKYNLKFSSENEKKE